MAPRQRTSPASARQSNPRLGPRNGAGETPQQRRAREAVAKLARASSKIPRKNLNGSFKVWDTPPLSVEEVKDVIAVGAAVGIRTLVNIAGDPERWGPMPAIVSSKFLVEQHTGKATQRIEVESSSIAALVLAAAARDPRGLPGQPARLVGQVIDGEATTLPATPRTGQPAHPPMPPTGQLDTQPLPSPAYGSPLSHGQDTLDAPLGGQGTRPSFAGGDSPHHGETSSGSSEIGSHTSPPGKGGSNG